MNDAQIGAWRPTLDALDAAGEHPYVELSAKDARARAGSPLVCGAIFEAGMASLQPAMLVRGRLEGLGAEDLRALFEAEYWLLSSEAKRSGAGFVLKQKLADVRRRLAAGARRDVGVAAVERALEEERPPP